MHGLQATTGDTPVASISTRGPKFCERRGYDLSRFVILNINGSKHAIGDLCHNEFLNSLMMDVDLGHIDRLSNAPKSATMI